MFFKTGSGGGQILTTTLEGRSFCSSSEKTLQKGRFVLLLKVFMRRWKSIKINAFFFISSIKLIPQEDIKTIGYIHLTSHYQSNNNKSQH